MTSRIALLVAVSMLVTGVAHADEPGDTTTAAPGDKDPIDMDEYLCSSASMNDALKKVRKRLVRVRSRMESAAGFVFHSGQHVLTTYSVVFWGEGLTVALPDGSETTLRVVAYNSEANIALLELDRGVDVSPLEIGNPPLVGDPVYAVGHTHWWGGDPTIHAGMVNSTSEGHFNTEALEHSFSKLGGPIVDCLGNVVGITQNGFKKEAASIAVATALTEEIGKQEIYRGPAVSPHFELGLLGIGSRHSAGAGLAVGVGITGLDGWEIKWRVGGGVLKEIGGDAHPGARVFGQTMAGYRAWLDDQHDYSLTLAAGGTIAWERFCPDPCADSEPSLTLLRLMPTFEAGVQFWPFTLSYQFQLDVVKPQWSVHQLMFGIDM